MLSRGMMKNILWRKKRVSTAVNAAVRRRNNSELHKCDNTLISFLSQIFFVKRQDCGYRGTHPLIPFKKHAFSSLYFCGWSSAVRFFIMFFSGH
ncbi:conserved hypothetical protein [Klebsiella variicola]|nr:conserved hypothetical protein [Klebsiella variicola]